MRAGPVYWYLLLNCFLFVFSGSSLAEPKALQGGLRIDLASRIESLEDKAGKLTIEELRSPSFGESFRPPTAKSPNFGFSQSVFWLRFKLDREWLDKEEQIALVFGYALIDDLKIYVPTPDGGYSEQSGGRLYPFHNRPLNTHFLHFILDSKNVSDQDYVYVRGRTSSSHQYPIELYSVQNFLTIYNDQSLGSRLYMGAIAIMGLYNAIFFLMTFDLLYLVYVGFILFSGSQVLSVQGFSYQYLWPTLVKFNNISVPFLMSSSVWLISLFSLMSLSQMSQYKILHRLVQAHVVLGVLGSLASFGLSYSTSIKISVLLTLTSSLCTLAAYLRLSLSRYRPAYFFLVSLGALLTASIVYSLKAVGVLPYNFFTENAPLIGSALQISLLTFGLADRFRELKAQHAKMQAQMIDLQKENIRRLDEQVAEKTADIRSILKTINQGIFTVSGDDLTIDPEKSDALTEMFPETAAGQSDPIHAIFAKSRLTSDTIDQIKAGFTAALDADALNFELNAACFPRVFEVESQSGHKKYFECDWSPILDQNETVKKILVAVRDTTEIRKLEEESKRKDQEMGTIMEILAIPSQKFSKAFHALTRLIHQVKAVCQQDQELTTRDWQQLYALLHTAKGNARTFGLKKLASMIHEVEEHVKHLSEQRTEQEWKLFMTGIVEIDDYLQYIARLAEEKLGRSVNEQQMSLGNEDWTRLLKSLGELEKLSPTNTVSSEVQEMRERLLKLRFFNMQDLIKDMESALRLAAEHLQKPFPTIAIEDQLGLYLKQETSEVLQSSLVHLLTNSLDHGIETPEKRRLAQKPEIGTITLRLLKGEADKVEILLGDDGAGLNLPVLSSLSQKKAIAGIDITNPHSLAESIFASGVSTHDKVSQLSGRGVGMDAVRELLRGLGGEIAIQFHSVQPQVDRCEPFMFRIVIPSEHFWLSKT